MTQDVFGNLKDWGAVLDKLEDLSRAGALGEHQGALIRILRYNDNWRLREAALDALPMVQEPSPALIDEVLAILVREDLYHDVRILAADALGRLFGQGAPWLKKGAANARLLREKVLGVLEEVLAAPQPPILHEAIRASLRRMSLVSDARAIRP